MCSKFGVGLFVAKTIFLLECGQTDRRDWTPYPRRRLYSRHG